MQDSTPQDDLGRLMVATSADIEDMPWQTSADQPGARYKVLWRSGDVVLGVMELDGGAVNAEHTHHGAHHHILILSGTCQIVGKELDAGSYVYIPPGVAHGVSEVAEGGCRFFYTYRPVEVSSKSSEYELGNPV
jgi:quercetin dioxygenase-like cupin family protein